MSQIISECQRLTKVSSMMAPSGKQEPSSFALVLSTKATILSDEAAWYALSLNSTGCAEVKIPESPIGEGVYKEQKVNRPWEARA